MNKSASVKQLDRCPECSARLNESSAGGPCPACLMQLGMQSWQDNQSMQQFRMDPTIGAAPAEGQGVSMEELAEKFPQYELLHLVGRGGMGTVYCARQKSLNRLVALKVIKPEANQRAEFSERFVREARAMALLNHPNIITVHDFGEVDNVYYFVMEYVDGINLRQMLKGNKLSPRHALAIIPSICDALQYAHDKGIVHRDIKPENILIDTDGTIKIADFGLAKLLDQDTSGPQLTQANHVMGTMHYMAPEQVERPLEVDHRADIYSLGVVIYELLTGELPLGRFAPPSEKVAIDARLDEIVMQTLAKEPNKRYQRVSDLKSELSSVSIQRPTQRPPRIRAESPIPVVATPVSPLLPSGKPPVIQRDRSMVKLPGPIPDCGFFGSVFHPKTWLNAGYLILSLPLGILYFVFVITGLSVGVGTLIVWVGVPILLLTFAGIRGFMAFDRRLTRHVLQTNVPCYRFTDPHQTRTAVERAKELVFSTETWKGVFYLVTKLVFGIVSFSLCIVLVTVPLSMISSPITVLFGNPNFEWGFLNLTEYQISTAFCVLGFMFAPLCAHGINGLAWLNAEWAKFWLSR